MYLELFMTTMKEYKRFAKQLPLQNNIYLTDSYDEAIYIAVQTRLMLLRKYTSKGKKNHVYIENLINEAKINYPHEMDCLDDIQIRFLQINSQSFEQILSDGTKLNLYESIEDIMYGLYLHADQDKIIRLSCTNEHMRFLCTKRYVENVEAIVLELYDFLAKINVSSISEKNHTKAPIIYLGESDPSVQQIKQSPYWGNMYGQDATNNEVALLSQGLSIEEVEILLKAIIFLDELKKENVSTDIMKNIVFEQQIEDWGDFSEAVSFYKKIINPGISNRVRFNQIKNVAYVRILPQVDNAFVISTPHIISDIYEVTFIKDNNINDWRIFALGGHIDPYI